MSTPETKLTVETNASAYHPDSLLSFNHANREVLRIAHDGRMIIGEGLSKEEATQEAAKLLIEAFEEQIKAMVDARVVNLRADLERFTGHGLLDCHAICDQRDAAVAERDQLRADRTYNHECINRLASATGTLGEKSGTVVDVALSTIAQLRAEVVLDEDLQAATEKSLKIATIRAEKAEADTARMDWLEKESPEDWGIRSITRDAIDKAMKEAIK